MFWDYSAEGVVGILVSLSLSTTVRWKLWSGSFRGFKRRGRIWMRNIECFGQSQLAERFLSKPFIMLYN